MLEPPARPECFWLNRQTRLFQFKIQQAIAIKDDELDRLEAYLGRVKIQVCDAQEQLAQIERDISQARSMRKASREAEVMNLQIQLANRNRVNKERLQDLHEQQEMEKYQISAAFESSLRTLSETNQSGLKERKDDIQRKIDQAHDVIDKYRQDLQTAKELEAIEEQKAREREQENYEIQVKTIAQLQSVVEIKNQERVTNLVRSKQKLSDCMAAIETMQEHHDLDVRDRHRVLDDLDTVYQNQLRQLRSEHRQQMALLITRKSDIKKKLTLVQGSFRKKQETTRSEMKQNQAEFHYVQQQLSASQPVTFDEKNSRREQRTCDKLRSEVLEAQKVLAAKVEQLRKARETNSDLRRRIGVAKHQYQYKDIINRRNM